MKKEGFYIVKEILKHRYKKGWRLLVLWDLHTVADATSEPIKNSSSVRTS